MGVVVDENVIIVVTKVLQKQIDREQVLLLPGYQLYHSRTAATPFDSRDEMVCKIMIHEGLQKRKEKRDRERKENTYIAHVGF